jgi:hypothetical protein
LSEEQGERIEIDNNRNFEQSSDISEPGEIIREEVVEVTEKHNTETFPLSSKEEEDQKNEVKTNNEDIYEQVKAQSIQLSSLSDMVESLQSHRWLVPARSLLSTHWRPAMTTYALEKCITYKEI